MTNTISANGFTGFLGRGAAQRELECILEVAAGKSSKEVAKRLGCSPSTVEKAIERVFFKLGVGSRASMVAKAFAMGLIYFSGAASPAPENHEDHNENTGVFLA